MNRQFDSDDYYQVLSIPRNASSDDIRAAYRRLAVEWHPDRNASLDAASNFQKIGEAYTVLINNDTRRYYDKYGKQALVDAQNLSPFAGGMWNPFDMFNRFLRDFGRDFGGFGSDWGRPQTSMFPSLMPPMTQDVSLMGRFPTVQRQRVWDEPLFLEDQGGKIIESKQVKTTT